MPNLPPLDCLRFFETAARLESFARAARELAVTAGAVAHRIRILERHLGDTLFERRRRGVRLNLRGQAYLGDVQRILDEIRDATERHSYRAGRRLRIVSVEGVAEKWLMPRLVRFKAAHPDIAIELDTHYGSRDPGVRDFDLWLTFVATEAPQLHRIPDCLAIDVLFEDSLIPFCSPVLIDARGRPDTPAELFDWPLLYHLGGEADWPYWFACRGTSAPDLTEASGFRVYSMIVRAAIDGLGAAVGSPSTITDEIEMGTLVPLFDGFGEVPMRYCLFTAADARHRTEVQHFRTWILQDAAACDPVNAERVATLPAAGKGG